MATDEINGNVIVSLVTAETQTQKYGGDLAGEGGHFNKLVPVTAAWQTVSIPWSELAKPTWGATMTLPAVAVKSFRRSTGEFQTRRRASRSSRRHRALLTRVGD